VSGSTTGSGDESNLPLQLAYLNSALQTGTRSPLDSAIVDFTRRKFEQSVEEGIDHGIDIVKLEDYDKIAEVPFDSSRRLLSVLVARTRTMEKGLLVTKGAVEEVLERCTKLYTHPSSSPLSPSPPPFDDFKPSKSTPLTADNRSTILQTAERLNEEGLRLIAVACKSSVAMAGILTMTTDDEVDLVFVGFLGFLDPLKPDAADAINRLAKLGVQVCGFSILFLNDCFNWTRSRSES
jgi:P-type Mg2+ transporter